MKYTNKSTNQLKVNGKMTSKGADRVGLVLALAAFLVALAIVIMAVSLIKWW